MSEINFEKLPKGKAMDETDINVRAYFSRFSDAQLLQYDPDWSDENVIKWDGNFRSDGALMLVCCERDVDIKEYRKVLEEHMKLRGISTSKKDV